MARWLDTLLEKSLSRIASELPLELIPVPDAQLQHGTILQLTFAREGKAVGFMPNNKECMPTIDLARAGVAFDCRGIEEIRERTAEYLSGKKFRVELQRALDADFYLDALLIDPVRALSSMALTNVAELQNEHFLMRSDAPETLKHAQAYIVELEEQFTIVPEKEVLSGVDISRPISSVRRQIIKLLIPENTPERKKLDAVDGYLCAIFVLGKSEESLESCQKKYRHFLLKPFLFLRKRRLEQIVSALSKEAEEKRQNMVSMLGLKTSNLATT